VSQGLCQLLDAEHLQAVLLHEQAHSYYRDTFWGFWLGWLRRLTAWLPHTEALWQELLFLRELRADHWAAQQSDPLLLAEALLSVVSMPVAPELGTALKPEAVNQRLAQRIEALLQPPEDTPIDRWRWVNLAWVLLPLLVIPFHH
jgi:Zn-dependent protease with chaperone function